MKTIKESFESQQICEGVDCMTKFGKDLFGTQYRTGEANTQTEDTILDQINDYINEYVTNNETFETLAKDLKELKSCFSKSAIAAVPTDKLYRGLNSFADADRLKKITGLDVNKIPFAKPGNDSKHVMPIIDARSHNTEVHVIKNFKYKPARYVESWTTDLVIAAEFAFDRGYSTNKRLSVILEYDKKPRKNFIFNPETFKHLNYGFGDESEVFRYSKEPQICTLYIFRYDQTE